MMNYLKQYLKKEKSLALLTAFAILVLFIWLILLQWEEKIWFGSELGGILTNLASGIVVSYIFYFIVVFIPKEKSKLDLAEYITMKSTYLCIEAIRLKNTLIRSSKQKNLRFPLSEEEFNRIFDNRHPVESFSFCAMLNRKLNWYEYLKSNLVVTTLQYIDDIFELLPHLDSELIKILNSIKESNLFVAAKREILPLDQSRNNARNGEIPKRLSEYFNLIWELNGYLDRNYSYMTKYQEMRKKEMCIHNF